MQATNISWPNELDEKIKKSLLSLGFPTMTPVQSSTIPLFLNYKDVIVQAVTGSGKTLAFLVPILQILLRVRKTNGLQKNKIYALILLPTRELATQINSILSELLEYINQPNDNLIENQDDSGKLGKMDREKSDKITSQLFIGGTSVRHDMETFLKTGSHILIGTPGRVQDLLSAHSNLFNVKDLEVMVMDEADRLLDLGFEKQLMAIICCIPKQRRTCLFSATMSEGLSRIVKAGLRNPVKIVVKVQKTFQDSKEKGPILITEQTIPESLQVEYIICTPLEKIVHLLGLFSEYPDKKFIIYFANGACVDYFYKVLAQLDGASHMTFHSLHGKMVPKRRQATFSAFSKAPSAHVLLCTDVAARGIDLPDIDVVVQFDAPQDPKVFAHRCGRSGRAGREGRAIVFLSHNEETYVEFLRVRKIPIQESNPLVLTVTQDQVASELVEICKSDRDSIKAFVSWIRSYNEHQASFIFQLKQIDMVSVCKSFGLLRIPKVPELKSLDLKGFVPSEGIQIDDIPYKDKSREKQRKENIKSRLVNSVEVKKRPAKTQAWSIQKKLKENRVERHEKKAKRRAAMAMKADEREIKNASGAGKVGDWKERLLQKKNEESGTNLTV